MHEVPDSQRQSPMHITTNHTTLPLIQSPLDKTNQLLIMTGIHQLSQLNPPLQSTPQNNMSNIIIE